MMEKGRENVEELKRELEKFVAPSGRLLEPLKSLDEKQMAAVATLSYLMQGVIQAVHEVDITSRFGKELAAISPTLETLPSRAAAPHLACRDEHIGYVTKEKECEEAGDPSHPSCKEAGLALGRLMRCEMAQLEKLKGIIEDLWGGLGPQPPWPKTKLITFFTIGLVIGLIVGLAVGYTIAPKAVDTGTTALGQQIGQLQGQVSTLQNQIQERDSQISNLTSQIAELEQPVPPLTKGEWNSIVTITGSTSKTTELFSIPSGVRILRE